MKRIICVLMTVLLVVSGFNLSVFAKDAIEYTPIENVEGIFVDQEGNYYFSDDKVIFTPVIKVNIDFSDYSTIENALKIEELHKIVKEDVLMDYQSNLEEDTSIRSGTIYYTNPGVEGPRIVNGYNMKCLIYTTSGDKVKQIATGTSVLTKVRAACYITSFLYGGGVLLLTNFISYFVSGLSLLENYCLLLGVDVLDVIASSSDSWKSTIDYTLVKRYYEYYDVNTWSIGLVTARVEGYDKTDLKLASASSTTQSLYSEPFSRQGEHYGLDSAWEFALGFDTDNCYYEYPTFKIGGKTFTFV